jgi:hypothetical protein
MSFALSATIAQPLAMTSVSATFKLTSEATNLAANSAKENTLMI